MKKTAASQKGFTIVELMIAMMVFSLVLLLCAFAVVHVGRMYYKGVINNRTQDVSRQIAQDVASTMQFTSRDVTFTPVAPVNQGGNMVGAYCMANTRYTYVLNTPLGSGTQHVLWKDNIAETDACVPLIMDRPTPVIPAGQPSAGSPKAGTELLAENMRLPRFSVVDGGTSATLDMVVSYGADPTLFEDATFTTCRGITAGGQFCAVSSVNTVVTKRL